MGETLLSGLLRSGRDPGSLVVAERRADHAAMLRDKYGVAVLSNVEAAQQADTVVLVVKPQDMDACSTRSATISRRATSSSRSPRDHHCLPAEPTARGSSVVRVMPNTPALVDQGMAAISPGTHCSPEHLAGQTPCSPHAAWS